MRLRLKAGLVIYIAKFDKCPGNYGYILIVNCVDVLGIFDIFNSADIVNIMNIVDILNNLNNFRSVDHIVLDCPYQLSSRGEAEGLVLKWCVIDAIFLYVQFQTVNYW